MTGKAVGGANAAGVDETATQRAYYANTAERYDDLHLGSDPEHDLALAWLSGVVDHLGARSVLDVGAGTGRTLSFLKQRRPELRAVGVEPVAELRQVGYEKGIPATELLDGNGADLPFTDGEFDIVCAFAVLHHVRHPETVVREMLRVADKAVFISDSNNFGQGSAPARLLKQALHGSGIWRFADWLKTGGKGYNFSGEDGLAYSYSVFDSSRLIHQCCPSVHYLNTVTASPNLYRTAGHVALLGIK